MNSSINAGREAKRFGYIMIGQKASEMIIEDTWRSRQTTDKEAMMRNKHSISEQRKGAAQKKAPFFVSCLVVGALSVAGPVLAQTSNSDSSGSAVTNTRYVAAAKGIRHAFSAELGGAPLRALRQARGVRSCESLATTSLSENAVVREAVIMDGEGAEPDWCRVTIEVRRSPAPNVIHVWIGLPLENWNGRFLGLGGGGFMGGHPIYVESAVPYGFAVAATDAGHAFATLGSIEDAQNTMRDATFVRTGDGRIDWRAVQNFAYLGIHDMTVFGKAVTTQFYGVTPQHSYFSGCSNGGRQGLTEVQRYPNDYDGVLAGAPGLNLSEVPALLWRQALMNELGQVAQCKFTAARLAAISACDPHDGIRDGLITDPAKCSFDPSVLIGTVTACGAISAQDAEVIQRVWDGPRGLDGARLWYGTMEDSNSVIDAIATNYVRYFLSETATWTPEHLGVGEFTRLFAQSRERYGAVFDIATPDIAAFVGAGGRTIIWHGLADPLPVAGSVRYVNEVRQELGSRRTNASLRLYLAPGVGHCAGGDGPQPIGLLGALIKWVELGQAPGALMSENRGDSGEVTRTRPLCPYPTRARYRGRGSIDDAANFSCRP